MVGELYCITININFLDDGRKYINSNSICLIMRGATDIALMIYEVLDVISPLPNFECNIKDFHMAYLFDIELSISFICCS